MTLKRRLRTSLLWAAAAMIAAAASQFLQPTEQPTAPQGGDAALVQSAYSSQRSGVWATVNGRVTRILPDDDSGSRHQRFLVKLDNGLSLLVAHNIDLAPRVPVEVGDALTLRGRYEWNAKGGVMHWTHADPGAHDAGIGNTGGWIEYRGQRYN